MVRASAQLLGFSIFRIFLVNDSLFLFWQFLMQNSMRVAIFVMVSLLAGWLHRYLVSSITFVHFFKRL